MMIWWIIIASVSLIGNGILIWMISNLLKQNNVLEDSVKNQIKLEDDILKYHEVVLGIISNAYTEFVRIDKKGSFSSDDEVGWSFSLLKNIIKDIKEKIEAIKTESKTEK